MTELDKALEIYHQDVEDPKNQSQYYDLFLKSVFYIPTHDEQAEAEETGLAEGDHVVPLILETEGNDYMMLFDSEERLTQWSQEPVSFVALPGHAIAEMSIPNLYWALNVGTEHLKQFVPDEIAWLKEVVECCNAEDEKQVG